MRSIISLVLLVTSLLTANTSQAIWGAVAGTIGTSIGIKKAGEELDDAVSRAELAGKNLIDHANFAAKDRLNQIDTILDDAFIKIKELERSAEQAIIGIIETATNDVLKIEKIFMDDLSQILWKAECSLKRATLEDAKELLGGLGEVLDTHEIIITAPIKIQERNALGRICFWCANPNEKKFKMKTPFGNTYVEIRDFMLDNIDKNITLDTPTHAIVDTYEYISRLARKTTCFYDETSSTYNSEYLYYLDKSKRYTNTLKVKVAL